MRAMCIFSVFVWAPEALMERSGVLHPWLQPGQLLTSALAARAGAGTPQILLTFRQPGCALFSSVFLGCLPCGLLKSV